jgi:hypothetical protein
MDSSSASTICTSILWRGTLVHELLPCLTSGMRIIGMYLPGNIVILLAEYHRGCQEDILGQSKASSVNMVYTPLHPDQSRAKQNQATLFASDQMISYSGLQRRTLVRIYYYFRSSWLIFAPRHIRTYYEVQIEVPQRKVPGYRGERTWYNSGTRS